MVDEPTAAVSGEAFLTERLRELERRVEVGERCAVVFDLDNTLFDTRSRTLWVARRFDEEGGTRYFESIGLDRVGLNARDTCARMGSLPPEVESAFVRFWEEAFWDPEAFVHDTPMQPVLSWVQRARLSGASLRFLTGRIEALRGPTTAQLARVGVADVSPETLWMKPDLLTRTLRFKASSLRRAMGRSWLGWYVTEGRDEIAYLQTEMPAGPWVLLDCSLQWGGPLVSPDTPTLERVF